MKLTVFYSWQSDLPNNSNRGFIEDCLKQSLKNFYKSNKLISEYTIGARHGRKRLEQMDKKRVSEKGVCL